MAKGASARNKASKAKKKPVSKSSTRTSPKTETNDNEYASASKRQNPSRISLGVSAAVLVVVVSILFQTFGQGGDNNDEDVALNDLRTESFELLDRLFPNQSLDVACMSFLVPLTVVQSFSI